MSKPYESYHSGDYLTNNPTWDEGDSEWKAGQVLKLLEDNHLIPKSIVEVGCGAGGVLASLYGVLQGVSLSGFDIAPDASQFWEKHRGKKISFSVGDFLKMSTVHFDVLLLLDVFEHVPDPFDFLSAIQGRAEYYIFHIPLDLSVSSVLREAPLLYVRRKVGHIHYYTKGLALELLDECGFEIIEHRYTGAAFSIPQKTIKTRLAQYPRRIAYALCKDIGVRLLGGETLMVLAKSK